MCPLVGVYLEEGRGNGRLVGGGVASECAILSRARALSRGALMREERGAYCEGEESRLLLVADFLGKVEDASDLLAKVMEEGVEGGRAGVGVAGSEGGGVGENDDRRGGRGWVGRESGGHGCDGGRGRDASSAWEARTDSPLVRTAHPVTTGAGAVTPPRDSA